jgi:hypothetical protein
MLIGPARVARYGGHPLPLPAGLLSMYISSRYGRSIGVRNRVNLHLFYLGGPAPRPPSTAEFPRHGGYLAGPRASARRHWHCSNPSQGSRRGRGRRAIASIPNPLVDV